MKNIDTNKSNRMREISNRIDVLSKYLVENPCDSAIAEVFLQVHDEAIDLIRPCKPSSDGHMRIRRLLGASVYNLSGKLKHIEVNKRFNRMCKARYIAKHCV